MENNPSAILIIKCNDAPGIVSYVSNFLYNNKGNIIDIDEYVDQESGLFFMRAEWSLEGFAIKKEKILSSMGSIIEKFSMECFLYFSYAIPKVALFVTKDNHCLYDLLSRQESGELKMEIPFIISNRKDLEPVANRFEIPFHYFPITKSNKKDQEIKEIELLKKNDVDLIILARYMQILSPLMVKEFKNRIINVHHSFLPAFPGAKPYHSAYERGVKLIGSTSHYVTEDLDEGPIISQGVSSVYHSDKISDFIRKGRSLEQNVLSRSVWLDLNRRVLVNSNKTVIFE